MDFHRFSSTSKTCALSSASVQNHNSNRSCAVNTNPSGGVKTSYYYSAPSSLDCNNNANQATDIDVLGLPKLPHIPELVLCLHFPGTEGWNNHWTDFNKTVKEFHQAMIDFNWKILEWYWIKAKQLERFGVKSPYVGGTLITGPRMTIVFTDVIVESDVLSEVRKCMPDQVCKDLKRLEKKGYKLCLSGKIFVFDFERVIVIDYQKDSDKTFRNCLRFTLFYKNHKVNMFEQYKRVYGGLKYSFIIGGVGGLIVSFLTGYFDPQPYQIRRCCPEPNVFWSVTKRMAATSVIYSIIERVLLLKFPLPQTYIISGSTGVICGTLLGLCDNCSLEQITYAATEFGLFSFLCNALLRKHYFKGTLLGERNNDGSI